MALHSQLLLAFKLAGSSGGGGAGGAGGAEGASAAGAGEAAGAAGAIGPAIGAVTAAAGKITETIGSITSALVGFASSVVETVQQLRPFAQALSPGTMKVLDQAFLNLQATIGQAVLPIFTVLGSVVSRAAGIIAPLFAALEGPVGKVSETLGAVFLPILRAVTGFLERFTGVVNNLAEIFSSIGSVFQSENFVITAVFETIVDAIEALVSQWVDLKSITEYLANAFKKTAQNVLLMSAFIAKLVGWDAFVTKLIAVAGREGNREQGVQAAPTNIGIKGFEGIGKDLATAAFGAGGKSVAETTNDYLREILPLLKTINDGASFKAILKEVKEDALKEINQAKKDFRDVAADVIATGIIGAFLNRILPEGIFRTKGYSAR